MGGINYCSVNRRPTFTKQGMGWVEFIRVVNALDLTFPPGVDHDLDAPIVTVYFKLYFYNWKYTEYMGAILDKNKTCISEIVNDVAFAEWDLWKFRWVVCWPRKLYFYFRLGPQNTHQTLRSLGCGSHMTSSRNFPLPEIKKLLTTKFWYQLFWQHYIFISMDHNNIQSGWNVTHYSF